MKWNSSTLTIGEHLTHPYRQRQSLRGRSCFCTLQDVYLQARRDSAAATRFFRRLMQSHGGDPRQIVTDKLRSHNVARRDVFPEAIHVTDQCPSNRVEQSHETTRLRGRGMGSFKSTDQARRFLRVHAAVINLSNLGRHPVSAGRYRSLGTSAFSEYSRAVA